MFNSFPSYFNKGPYILILFKGFKGQPSLRGPSALRPARNWDTWAMRPRLRIASLFGLGGPPPCNSGIIRISEDPNIIPIIPYSHYYWVGVHLMYGPRVKSASALLQLVDKLGLAKEGSSADLFGTVYTAFREPPMNCRALDYGILIHVANTAQSGLNSHGQI